MIRPTVDVNLFVHNGAATVAEALDSVLTQTWQSLTVTVIDNASTDDTCRIVADIAATDGRVRLQRNAANIGPVLNCQKAFWHGQSDYVMPKTADDLLAPDFIEAVMEELRANPATAMCHAAGVVFGDDRRISQHYPPEHRLHATGPDAAARARHVMARYTSAPAFWGIYRRATVDLLAPLAYRPGWDHAVLAELALYGEIRHVPDPLFWRRHGGKPVDQLARGCSQFTQRGLPHDDDLADLYWAMPLIGTAYAHIERFALARLGTTDRLDLMDAVPPIFRARWLPVMRREATLFRDALPPRIDRLASALPTQRLWSARQIAGALDALQTLTPEIDVAGERLALQALLDADQTVPAYSS